ncbi:MAG: pyridoxal-phosphate dependent enzyme [Desulfovibrionaceae bacterium]|jgi:threonine dehydratase|nr:pyridoxal-phosphate dependent enzyme [Desulfovibrionaceae bacterium]
MTMPSTSPGASPLSELPSLAEIEAAAPVVHREFPPAQQYHWALLSRRLGADCWVKHENHTPVGAFKTRGGLTFFDRLRARGALPREAIGATRGNHGQSIGWAARMHGVRGTIVVPRGNAVEKNAAMRALGHAARIVGVVSRHVSTCADSLAAGRVAEAPCATRIADDMAARRADPQALWPCCRRAWIMSRRSATMR